MGESSTPMMKQYRQIKSELADDTLLFFRLGDFYEMFFEDAKIASSILDVALTKRNKIPMCGVPHHAVEHYLAKVIRAGKKVAICEQVEDASAAKGIVRRAVTRVITPGTIMEEDILESRKNNYLAGFFRANGRYGMAMLDLSTGEFWAEELESLVEVEDNLRRFGPSECVLPEEQLDDPEVRGALEPASLAMLTSCEDWTFEYDAARDYLLRHFGVQSLESFDCEDRPAIAGAAGGVLYYVRDELRRQIGHVKGLRVKNPSNYLVLDQSTCSNLALLPMRGEGVDVSLLKVMDSSVTAMGGRLMRDWIVRPLAERDAIAARHDAVAEFCRDRGLLADIRELLAAVKDLERLVSRLGAGSGNARDLRAVASSLSNLTGIKALFDGRRIQQLRELNEQLILLPDLIDLIDRAIVEEPPVALKQGGIVGEGYNSELDELRGAAAQGKKWLAEYQASEQARTGIRNLKVRHNRVFGYYIEISKGQLANVPEEYDRKQTLVNAERFITPRLKEYEGKVLGAQDRSIVMEYDIFVDIREAVVRETSSIQGTARALAGLDALASFAERALALGFVRPVMTEGDLLRIRDGRHPIVEQVPGAEKFVPNDVLLDTGANQLLIITGPNMAGKSTYIRQVAVIVIMAQMGSFVPAAEAEIGVIDRVFTRVGASDDLARGRSTFMVEMQEAANILNNATTQSLIILDEIGRGTSTFDGISIAWAVAEFLHNNEAVKAKTMFATHYHELTDLALTMPGIKNYNVLVREKNDKVVFLRKIVEGAADKSYGIQVARLAGLPQEVIDRAKEILANLEEGELNEIGQPKIAKRRSRKSGDSDAQLSLL